MGFKLSRLAFSVAVAINVSLVAQAAEKTDDFYIEIKGPTETSQPAKKAPESSTKQIDTRFVAEAYRPDIMDRFNITPNTKVYGPVRKTDTLWSIANAVRKLHPRANISTNRVMQAFFRKNRQSFMNTSYGSLYAGSYLTIPSLDEIIAAAKPAVAESAKPASTPVPAQQSVASTPAAESAKTVIASTKTPESAASKPVESKPEETTDSSSVLKQELLSGTKDVHDAAHEPVVDARVKQLVHGDSAAPATTETTPVASTAASATPSETEHPADLSAALAEKEKLANALREKAAATESENKQLKAQLDAMNAQVMQLQNSAHQQTQQQQQIQALQDKLKQLETAHQATASAAEPVAKPEEHTEKSGFLHEMLATPLNLLLLLSIPILAILMIVSFWLRARAKQEMAAREQEMAENTALLMDDDHDQFSDLFSGDVSKEDMTVPDLSMADELEPQLTVDDVATPQPDEVYHDSMHDEPTDHDMPDTPIAVEPQIMDLDDPHQALALPEVTEELPAEPEPEPAEEQILSEEDLLSVLMDDEDVPERKKPSISMEKLAELDTQSPSDASDEDPLVSQLNLDKLMSDKGLQMNQTVVSEPDGWEVTPDADVSVDQKNSSKADVTLQEVNSESDKEWLKQFEEEQQASTSTDYRSIDELLAEAEQQDEGDKPELSANLDVGFDEYPDVIPDHDDVDIDDDGGVGAKLDLARAYLEIDDKASAKELLLEVQAEGDDKQIKEAEKLLTKIG